MTMQLGGPTTTSSIQSAPNFRSWQLDTFERGLLPVIGIAGGRGKSTVVRLLDAIFQRAHLRTATWTNLGIEIRGKRQRGEISGWSLALSRLADVSIDIAIQELHWSTINAVGLPPSSYPILGVTNLVGSLDAVLSDDQSLAIRRGSHRVADAVHADGVLVVNGDDPALVDAAHMAESLIAVTSLSRESPTLRRHLENGGAGVWLEEHDIRSGELGTAKSLCNVHAVPASFDATAPFETANVLTAIAVAASVGVDFDTITAAVQEFQISPEILPGSFNVYTRMPYRIVVDSAVPSWHLKPLLRAINPGNKRRQITVIGDLERLPEHDIQEIGRLLGRHAGAIILHSNKDPRLLDSFRKGIAINDYPPVVIHLPTERRALNRALKTARADDIVLILTDADSGPATRAIQRQIAQS